MGRLLLAQMSARKKKIIQQRRLKREAEFEEMQLERHHPPLPRTCNLGAVLITYLSHWHADPQATHLHKSASNTHTAPVAKNPYPT